MVLSMEAETGGVWEREGVWVDGGFTEMIRWAPFEIHMVIKFLRALSVGKTKAGLGQPAVGEGQNWIGGTDGKQ